MKRYKATLHEVLSTTYMVEADSEEDALDAVRAGEGYEVSKVVEALDEFNIPEDSAVLAETGGSDDD